jgi:hypothetical protein
MTSLQGSRTRLFLRHEIREYSIAAWPSQLHFERSLCGVRAPMSHPHLERCTARRCSAHAREIGTAEAFTPPVPGGIHERIRRIATLHPSGSR